MITFSRLIAGVMKWGAWGAGLNALEMAKLIEKCLEYDINSFDHADIYGGYTTEKEFGDAFALTNIPREKIKLITKCGIMMPCPMRPQYNIKHYNTSASHILSSVDQSLINLNTDYIDLLLIHRPSPIMDFRQIADTFSALLESGKVRSFGVSNFTPWQCDALAEHFPIVANQVEISLSRPDALYDGTLANCTKHKMIPMAWSPMAGDVLFSKNQTTENQSKLSDFERIAHKYGWTLPELALHFLLHHPANIYPVIGTSNAGRVKEAVGTLSARITDEQWFEILEVVRGREVE
ncbi:MAG: aldo/keto reductase [Saprospiraceae bacterium]|nr:aldo/keto reductase [Saprospiraceae bacterium]